MLPSVLTAYGLKDGSYTLVPYGAGLINHTWKVTSPEGDFILQKINTAVFSEPCDLAHNLKVLSGYRKENHPDYFFVAPCLSLSGEEMVFLPESGYFRLFPFVKGSHSKTVVTTGAHAYEAARQFGGFARRFSGLDTSFLRVTIPAFHDLSLRYRQLTEALRHSSAERLREAKQWIQMALHHSSIEEQYRQLYKNSSFVRRVTHHDTKISNVLFDASERGICVIDLDTVMPGFFFSDVGDMLRTYLPTVDEEESDYTKIEVRKEIFQAVAAGYLDEMSDQLSPVEREHFFFAGKFMIYMQAIRFLTDYLNNDVYYRCRYEGHNLVRAKNQLVLLEKYIKEEPGWIKLTVT